MANAGELTFDIKANYQGALAGLDAVGKKLKKMSQDVGQVSAAMTAFAGVMVANAAKFDKGVASAVKDVQGAYNALSVEIGRALLPAIKSLADFLNNIIEAWKSLSPETRAAIVDFSVLAVQIAGVVAIGAKLASIAIELGGIVLAAAPVLVVLGLVAGLAGIIYNAYKKNLGGVGDLFRDFVDWLKDIFSGSGGLGEVISTALMTPVNLVGKLIAGVMDNLVRLDKELGGVLGLAENDTVQAVYRMGDKLALATLDKVVEYGKTAALELGGQAYDGLVAGFKDALDWLKAAFPEAAKAFEKFLSGSAGRANPQSLSAADAMAKAEAAEFQKLSAKIKAGVAAGMKSLEALDNAQRDYAAGLASMGEGGNIAGLIGSAGTSALGYSPERIREIAGEDSALQAQLQAQGQRIANTIATFASKFTQKLGKAGEILSSAIQGGQAGGIWGAVIGVLVELISSAKGFEDWIAIVNDYLKTLANAFSGLFSGLKTLAGAEKLLTDVVAGVLGPIMEMLGNVLGELAPTIIVMMIALRGIGPTITALSSLMGGPLGNAMRMLFGVSKYLAAGLMKVVQGIDWALSVAAKGLASQLHDIAKFWEGIFGEGSAGGLMNAAISLNNFGNSMDAAAKEAGKNANELVDLSFPDAISMAADAANTFSDKVNAISESLTNAPEGFKVNRLRYAAMDAVGGTAASFGGGDSTLSLGGGATPISVTVELSASAEKIVDEVKTEVRRDRIRTKSNRQGAMGDDL